MYIDVSTGGELHVALAAGVPARRGSSSTATTSRRPSWRRALELGVGRIVVDSFDEIDRLERLLAEDGRARRCSCG